MLTPVSTRPRLSVGVLVVPFLCGLVFFAASSLAHHAGTTWSPKPDWAPGPATTAPLSAPDLAPASTGTSALCNEITETGLGYRVIGYQLGGYAPRPMDTVRVRFRGWTFDGEPLPGLPADGLATFRVSNLIPGWVEGLGLMAPGDHLRLCIPESLAYQGRPNAPSGMMIFEIELLAIEWAR